MKIKTSNLIGRALDWAVCVAEGNSPVINPVSFGATRFGMFDSPLGFTIKRYSTDWAHGGPIIEQERMQIDCFPLEKYASKENISSKGVGNPFHGCGPTPLIAAMRCYVASKLGDEVEIPPELLK